MLVVLGVGFDVVGAARTQMPVPATPFDLLIINARLVDGTGAPGRAASIGIRGGKIAQVGQGAALAGAAAAQRFDARGMVAAPGFIDVHTHADDLASHPRADNFLQMGVTTIVAGNGGRSSLDIGDALDAIRNEGPSINFAKLVGHNTIRQAVMGLENRAPTLPELSKMKSLVFKAMADGAVGFSTDVQEAPGMYAQLSEIIELMQVASNEGGVYAAQTHGEGAALEERVRQSIRVAELTDAPLEISLPDVGVHRQQSANAAVWKLMDDARKRGVIAQADDAVSFLGVDEHVLSMEETVRTMTSLPASHFGFAGRGVVAPGAFADLVIFDPATIAKPAADTSSTAAPVGVALVIVNGAITVRDGHLTGARAGQILARTKAR